MLYYYAALQTPLDQLIKDLTYHAKKENFDVINALEIMDTKKVLTSQRFVQGSGVLKYYLFNWQCAPFASEEIGIFLV